MQPEHQIFSLPDGQAVYCLALNNQELELHHSSHAATVYLSGAFAAAVRSIHTPQPNTAYLRRIEQAYPQLQGLSQAQATSPTAQQLLLGESLGMLFIELTSRCNERCLHCYAESDPECNDFLSTGEIQRSLDDTRKLGRPFVQFTGGDPLIHRDLVALVEYAHRLDFQGIEIYTNGLLLTDKLLQRLLPCTPRFSFSIYADVARVHDTITRVPGSWKRTVAAMHRAQDSGLEIRAGVVVMKENAERMAHMSDFLQSEFGLTAGHIRFDPVNRVGRGSATSLPAHIQISPSHAGAPSEIRRGKLCLAANGDVYPCIFSRNLPLGNIRKQSLPKIIASLSYRPERQITPERWKSCQEQLSCSDCQMIACLLRPSGRSGKNF